MWYSLYQVYICRFTLEQKWSKPKLNPIKEKIITLNMLNIKLFIDREAREIMHLVASVRPSVRLSVHLFGCTQGTLYTTTTVYGLLVHQEGAI